MLNGCYWTYNEIGLLIDLKIKGYTWYEISIRLGRSISACQNKFYYLKNKIFKN